MIKLPKFPSEEEWKARIALDPADTETNSCPVCGKKYTGGRCCGDCVQANRCLDNDFSHNTIGGWMSSEM